MNQPRVVMLIERYAPLIGGSETQCQLQAGALHRAGVPVFVLTRRIDRATPGHELIDDIDVYRLWPSGVGRVWKELGFILSTTVALTRFRNRYNIIHLHSGTSIVGAWVIVLSKMLGKKTAVKVATAGDIAKNVIETSGQALARPSMLHRLINRLINWALRRADRILCISQEIFAELQAHNFSSSRLAILPNAIDTDLYRPEPHDRLAIRQRLGLPTDRKIILYTGRLIHRKGIDVLLEAWHTMPALSADACLVLVGGQSASLDAVEAELRSYVTNNRMDHSVIFAGETHNTLPYLQAADIFVFPSRREGLSNSLLEALSVGLPTVATSIGGNIDLITDASSGLLVPSGQAQALGEALQKLIHDPTVATRLGQAARTDMISRFSLQQLLPQLRSVYASMLHD